MDARDLWATLALCLLTGLFLAGALLAGLAIGSRL